jgi:solute:Na+ symporter, SSS family
MINTTNIIIYVALYFATLLIISYVAAKKSDKFSYFLGNKQSPWYLVALGMIGDSLSGVTFISVPGKVGIDGFGYFQVVLGYIFGYAIIVYFLLPLYYKLNLVSIYTYLEERFGKFSKKTGALFFIVSRLLGASGRLFLTASVLQLFLFSKFNIPFSVSVCIIMTLMILYTYKGGIKSLIYTDALQSTVLIAAVIFTVYGLSKGFENQGGFFSVLNQSSYFKIWNTDVNSAGFFLKQLLGGCFIAVAMTGLDQNMMQKNLTCKSLPEAQKNIVWFTALLVIINFFFLCLGAGLYIYAAQHQVQLPMNADGTKVLTDKVYPFMALESLGGFTAIFFILGITAATFSSADSVLATLTTSTYYDLFEWHKREDFSEQKSRLYRTVLHIGFALLLLIFILFFQILNNSALIDTILFLAGITYGPLLGLFFLGIFTKVKLKDKLVPIVCIGAATITYFLKTYSKSILGNYQIGPELILINAFITILGLSFINTRRMND